MSLNKRENWKIYKFGGSSLADTACFVRVSKIILDSYYANKNHNHGIVVSAMGGFTDLLIKISEDCTSKSLFSSDEYKLISERISILSNDLLEEKESKEYLDNVFSDFDEIKNILEQSHDKEDSGDKSEIIAGYGELWSARLMNIYLNKLLADEKSVFLDSRKVIFLDESNINESIDWQKSNESFSKFTSSSPSKLYLITGFIASRYDGISTNLGRNGSDYSAAIFASLFDAEELVIWTDVDGVLSADPNRVKNARLISNLSYNEAMELAYFGAKVIHPKTFSPLIKQEIPIYIRNTFDPEKKGTKISSNIDANREIKGITVIESMALINVEGTGMLGVPGTADKLFASLKEKDISVSLISQASSEHSICIAIPQSLTEIAYKQINDAFSEEIKLGLISNIDINRDLSVLAVVGDNMVGQYGIAGKFFNTLGEAEISVRAIAQGSSERNISAVIDSKDTNQALNEIHKGFFMTKSTLNIGIIGIGVVGSELLNQLSNNAENICNKYNIKVEIKGIAKSNAMILAENSLDFSDWKASIESSSVDFDVDKFVKHVSDDGVNQNTLIIDCTSNEDISSKYPLWLESGLHVITPNKKAFSGNLKTYKKIKDLSNATGNYCFYETTVAAGLPVISTVQSLIETGDIIHSIEGIFSGTLAYLFNVYDGTKPFSQIVSEAKSSGYTEPDPRDDLTGMDVARKLAIIGREAGRELEINTFSIENLVPEELMNVDPDQFLDLFKSYDNDMQQRFLNAKKNSMVLRYTAKLNKDNEVSIGLSEYPRDHAFSNIQLTDNIIQIQSDRYSKNPMVIQGPGAGPGVTAAGIFADIITLIKLTN